MRSRCSCHTIIWVHVWLRTSFDLSTGPTWRHPQPLASRPVQGKTVLSENTFLPVSNAELLELLQWPRVEETPGIGHSTMEAHALVR